MKKISLYLIGIFYIFAGLMHFVNSSFYLQLMPPFIPWPLTMVYWSGVIEIVLGILVLLPKYSTKAAWGIILLLIAVFPANIYTVTSGGAGFDVPIWVAWARLPVQGLFIAWAYWHTKE